MKLAIMTALVFLAFFMNINAQWTNNTAINNAICDTTGDQATPKIAATSDGGCYIVWFDNRGGSYAVYLQKIDAAGNHLLVRTDC